MRTRSWLVALETTIAIVLLVTGALLLTGFSRTAAEAPGFDPAHVIAAQVRLPIASYPSHEHRATFVRRVVEEIAEALSLAPSTVKLDWQKARAWLYRELKET